MTYKEITQLTPEALQQELRSHQQRLHKLCFAHAVSPIENPMRLRSLRKTIARLHTAQQ